MKKIITFIVVFSTMFTIAFSAKAAVMPLYRGDVDLNGKITIEDATCLQNYLSGNIELSKRQLCAAEVTGDDVITINDVTMIQKKCAKMIDKFNTDNIWNSYPQIKNLYADYSSGKAPVNTPITFTGEAKDGVAPFEYAFYVNNVLVQDKSEYNTFTYTFDKAGTYYITMKLYNGFDEYTDYTIGYDVIDQTGSELIISSIYLDKQIVSPYDASTTVTAIGINGSTPYEFKFNLDNGDIIQDFSTNNTLVIDKSLSVGTHTVQVTLKDSNDTIVSEDFTFEVKNIM